MDDDEREFASLPEMGNIGYRVKTKKCSKLQTSVHKFTGYQTVTADAKAL